MRPPTFVRYFIMSSAPVVGEIFTLKVGLWLSNMNAGEYTK